MYMCFREIGDLTESHTISFDYLAICSRQRTRAGLGGWWVATAEGARGGGATGGGEQAPANWRGARYARTDVVGSNRSLAFFFFLNNRSLACFLCSLEMIDSLLFFWETDDRQPDGPSTRWAAPALAPTIVQPVSSFILDPDKYRTIGLGWSQPEQNVPPGRGERSTNAPLQPSHKKWARKKAQVLMQTKFQPFTEKKQKEKKWATNCHDV